MGIRIYTQGSLHGEDLERIMDEVEVKLCFWSIREMDTQILRNGYPNPDLGRFRYPIRYSKSIPVEFWGGMNSIFKFKFGHGYY